MSAGKPVRKTHEGYFAHYSTLLHLRKSLGSNSITIDGSNGSGRVDPIRPIMLNGFHGSCSCLN
jgi:hypothetical protein